jgi:hypothetical protein
MDQEYKLDCVDGLEYEKVIFRTKLSNMIDDELYGFGKRAINRSTGAYKKRIVYYVDSVFQVGVCGGGYRINFMIKGQKTPSVMYASPIPHDSMGFIWKFVDDFVKVNRRDHALEKLGI